MSNAFERYASFIQKYIYQRGWTDLRDVQVEACEAIMDTNKHVIVASGTASGKTEAVFFPILTLLEAEPSQSVSVIYIGPLKALINDQFERLEELLTDSGIEVWPWHGEISQAKKKRMLSCPQGILQITPESLQAMLMLRPQDIGRLFGDLRFVVIDEIHALMGTDRGLQIMCLIAMLERMTGCSPRRIGLSATLNEYEPAMEYLSMGSNLGACAVGINGQRRKLALCVESFGENDEYYQYLYENCHTKKCLIFANSRAKTEEVVAHLKTIAQARGEEDIFYVHHGSIAAKLRTQAEHALRDQRGPTVAAATLTLELGIDIGDLDTIIQLGAPYTCSSFVQRLGRSGRRSNKSQMMFLHQWEEQDLDCAIRLPWELLRMIAVIQLYLEEHWVEPFEKKEKPFSLLAHQTLCMLMTFGELSAAELARKVLLLPVFKSCITPEEYRELLRYMIQKEYLLKLDGGGLIVGEKGEKIANHYSFYAVFAEEETYRVLTKEGEIGTLSDSLSVDEVFVLAGRAWKVMSIDEKRKTLYAVPADSSVLRSWMGTGSEIHAKIVERMKKVLKEDTIYPYLQPRARRLLAAAREEAAQIGLLDREVIALGEKSFLLCPWTGNKLLHTIYRLLTQGLREELKIGSVTDCGYYLKVSSELGVQECVRRMRELAPATDAPEMVLPKNRAPRVDKYDYMVPENLLRKAYLYHQMAVDEAVGILRGIEGECIKPMADGD